MCGSFDLWASRFSAHVPSSSPHTTYLFYVVQIGLYLTRRRSSTTWNGFDRRSVEFSRVAIRHTWRRRAFNRAEAFLAQLGDEHLWFSEGGRDVQKSFCVGLRVE